MHTNRCPAGCSACGALSRREFLIGASAASAALLGGCASQPKGAGLRPSKGAVTRIRPCGPASKCEPTIQACFVRRKGDYGMWWPGAIYDGKAARKKYTRQMADAAKELGIKLLLRPQPIYSAAQADAWVAEAAAAKPDGLLVVLLDRQRHAWPTANKAIDTKIPTVVFSPVGSSFTTNTAGPSKKGGASFARRTTSRRSATA